MSAHIKFYISVFIIACLLAYIFGQQKQITALQEMLSAYEDQYASISALINRDRDYICAK